MLLASILEYKTKEAREDVDLESVKTKYHHLSFSVKPRDKNCKSPHQRLTKDVISTKFVTEEEPSIE